MVVTKLGKKVGALVTTLAVACAAVSLAPIPAVAQEEEQEEEVVPVPVLPTGEYGMNNYERGLGDVSTGETKLYLIKDQFVNVGHEGSSGTNVQMNVTVPVGIHFTVLKNRCVQGPANGNVAFKNRTNTSDVHVSGIAVQEANGSHIKKQSDLSVTEDGALHDSLYINMRPDPAHLDETGKIVVDDTGHDDEFGAYVGDAPKSPAYKHDWDIPAGEALALDNLNGECPDGVVFDALDPSMETQIGSVRWTVRLGTRAEADAHDASVTLRFHANGGYVVDGQPLQDLVIPILNAEKLPDVEEIDVNEVDVEGVEVEGLESVSDIKIPSARDKLACRFVNTNNELVDFRFDDWCFDNRRTKVVETLDDLAYYAGLDSVTDLAGKTFTLYAHYVRESE